MKHPIQISIRVIFALLLAFLLVKETMLVFATQRQAGDLISKTEINNGNNEEIQYLRALQYEAAEDFVRLDKAAVTKAELVQIISDIESTGKSLGLTLTISSINANSQENSPSTVRFAIETNGPWGANMTFLRLMEQLPYKTSINETRLTSASTTWRGNTTITLTTMPQ